MDGELSGQMLNEVGECSGFEIVGGNGTFQTFFGGRRLTQAIRFRLTRIVHSCPPKYKRHHVVLAKSRIRFFLEQLSVDESKLHGIRSESAVTSKFSPGSKLSSN